MHKILFVTADDELRLKYRTHIASLGHYVVVAANGREGIEACERYRPEVTVVDYNLPDMSGTELIERVRPQSVCILLTEKGDIETGIEARRLGVEFCLAKPVKLTRLGEVVEKAAEKASLSKENSKLRSGVPPAVKGVLIKVGLLVALALVSAVIGLSIGSGGEEDPRNRHPIPIPIENDGQSSTEAGSVTTSD